jgi:hypothetical protein
MEETNLTVEQRIILMSSVELSEKDEKDFSMLFKQKLNWPEMLYQLTIHRTMNIFYYNLKKYNLTRNLDKEIKRLLESQYRIIGERNRFYAKELTSVITALRGKGVVSPVLKGNYLASAVYPSIETRVFNDIDLLILIEDVNKITETMESLGFIQGNYDEASNTIQPASRKDKIFHQINTHELHEFQKISINPFAKLIEIDFNHNILWKGNCPYNIPAKELIDRSIKIPLAGNFVSILDPIDNIIQLSAHLYKEATMMMWITDLRDLKIYKFADIFMFITKNYNSIDWDSLVERIKGYHIEKVVYFAFHFIGRMYGRIVPDKVLTAISPGDLDYLEEYGIEDSKPARWCNDFFIRLFDTDRVLTIEEKKCHKMNEFLSERTKDGSTMNHARAK